MATSGGYERGNHIVDPRTGIPAEGLMSVTVIAPEAVADAYSTVVLALGRDGLDWLAAHAGVEAMAVTDEGQVVTTAGFDRHRTA
jgi:thiamine biosynthesis lipoprotein